MGKVEVNRSRMRNKTNRVTVLESLVGKVSRNLTNYGNSMQDILLGRIGCAHLWSFAAKECVDSFERAISKFKMVFRDRKFTPKRLFYQGRAGAF